MAANKSVQGEWKCELNNSCDRVKQTTINGQLIELNVAT